MSQSYSISIRRRYGLARVCRLWTWARSTIYASQRRETAMSVTPGKRGPKTSWSDADLTELIREVLAGSLFLGEGYRKVWARLRLQGIRTSKGRVLRLMRLAGLLAPTRQGRPHGPAAHDGTIVTDRPDVMWGIDATGCLTDEGQATIFVSSDHCSDDCVGIHAARPGNRFEALEPLRQGVAEHFGAYRQNIASGLSLRHDHGSQFVSDHFTSSGDRYEIAILALTPSSAPGRGFESGTTPGCHRPCRLPPARVVVPVPAPSGRA
jgi:hypothetical protein